MNELNKLIEQYERENPGKKAQYERALNSYSCVIELEDEFINWMAKLASRPTCGKEQRKFLDEVEKFIFNHLIGGYVPEHGDSMLFQSEFESDLQKVVQGE